VVMEERRMRYENDPDGKLYEIFNATAFLAHPYSIPTIGWMSDIEQLNVPQMTAFHNKYYVPANLAGSLVGDFQMDEALRLIKKYFGPLPKQERPPDVTTQEPWFTGERTVSVTLDANPQVMIGYHRPDFSDSNHYAFEVLEMLLGNGRTSRLYRTLVLEQKIAADISVWTGPGQRYSNLLDIDVVPMSPHTNQEMVAAVDHEIEVLKTQPVPQHELQKIVNQIEAAFIAQMNSNMGMAGELANAQQLYGNWQYILTYRDHIAKVTPDDIMRICKQFLTKENRVVAYSEQRKP
jgi:predicted Zn-dependent peptidase